MPLRLIDLRGKSFFGDPALDTSLPAANEAFWAALIGIIDGDALSAPRAILDVGCHSGGLLDALTRRFTPARIFGIEPLDWARAAASRRLASVAAAVTLLDVSQWDQVPNGAIDLVTSHEVLYLEPDVPGFMRNVHRVLALDGHAYVVLGCHAENPLWHEWKSRLIAAGRTTYDHVPLDIMEAAAAAGLSASVQPLRRVGWITYDPRRAEFPYPDVRTMFDHHYRHKLVFRLRVADSHAAPT